MKRDDDPRAALDRAEVLEPHPFRSQSRRPPDRLRDSSGFLPASVEVAWLDPESQGAGVKSNCKG